MKVVVVKTAAGGDVDMDDLRAKVEQHRDDLAAIMVTYPSTHGVFEDTITDLCALVHDAGGQVYVDGANLNALVGLAQPGQVRRRRLAPQPAQDVLHPARRRRSRVSVRSAVRAHLAPHLPNHPLAPEAGPETGVGPISAAPYGSAEHPADLLGLRAADGRGRPDPGHPGRRAQRQLRRGPAARALPGALLRARRRRRPRVHPRPARPDHATPASPSTTSPSGSSTTASTRRRCRSRWRAR